VYWLFVRPSSDFRFFVLLDIELATRGCLT